MVVITDRRLGQARGRRQRLVVKPMTVVGGCGCGSGKFCFQWYSVFEFDVLFFWIFGLCLCSSVFGWRIKGWFCCVKKIVPCFDFNLDLIVLLVYLVCVMVDYWGHFGCCVGLKVWLWWPWLWSKFWCPSLVSFFPT